MITYLDRKLSLKIVIWLFPIAFIVHDLEEIFTVNNFIQTYSSRVPEKILAFMPTAGQFSIAVGILFFLCIMVSFLGTRSSNANTGIKLYTFAVTILFFNVFTHLGQAVMIGGYSPGLITAISIALPYTLYVFHRLFKDDLIKQRFLFQTLLVASIVFVPLTIAIVAIGKLIGSLLGV